MVKKKMDMRGKGKIYMNKQREVEQRGKKEIREKSNMAK
jgi:hypothetical protein